MKIADIKTAVVAANFDWTFVRVYSDDGVYGTGETFMAPALPQLIEAYKPLLLGEDPRDIDRLWQKMRMATSYDGGSGLALHAITGIEAALVELTAKSMNVPVYRLLGGKYRDKVRIYADCHAGESLESLGSVLDRRHFDGPVIRDGYVTVPDGPGFGVELNEEVARKYAKAGEPFFE